MKNKVIIIKADQAILSQQQSTVNKSQQQRKTSSKFFPNNQSICKHGDTSEPLPNLSTVNR